MSNEDIISTLTPNKTRLRDADGFVATVRYIGPVASAKRAKENWVGVEWDDPHRGKHDGSVISRTTNEIVRHFSLEVPSLTGGSFLKLSKIDTGVELNLKLIQSRYVGEDAPLVAPNNLLPFTARTSSGRDKPIEFLGEMKVRQYQQLGDLDDISLRSMGISRVSKIGEGREELTSTFQHVRELDVSGNLFSDWQDIFDILNTFQTLTWLSFASNKIYDIPSDIPWQPGMFGSLKVLNVNRSSIASFRTVEVLDKLCPNLEELCIAYSDLSDMDTGGRQSGEDEAGPLEGFQALKLLDCSNCNLGSWDNQIRRLRKLPKLETLIVDDNPLTEVTIQDPSEFAQLQVFQITGNDIESWTSIESLGKLSTLKSLRFRNCPLTNDIGSGEARAGTIARMPQIEALNASNISDKERVEAERRYVSTVSREMILITSNTKGTGTNVEGGDEDPSTITNAFKDLGLFEKYPRFEELMAKHKEAMLLSRSANAGSGSIANSAVSATIRSMTAESCTVEPVQKRLPSSLKVGRLKIMCAKIFGLDVEDQLLHFRNEVSRPAQ